MKLPVEIGWSLIGNQANFPPTASDGRSASQPSCPLQEAPDMTMQSVKPDSVPAQPAANGEGVPAPESKSTQAPPEARKGTWRRRLLAGAVGVAVVAVVFKFGIPWVEEMLNTVSTDDAYVNGHVTFVAP